MKYIKTFEDINEDGWIIDISNIVNKSFINKMPDISDSVKKGDIVIGVWYGGDFEVSLLKLEELDFDDDDKPMLGACDEDSCYCVDLAWGIYSLEDYKKYDPDFEIKLNQLKYNL